MRRWKILASSLLLTAILAAGNLSAGTICGTIRDGTTGENIARAGIFIRTQAGAYTGHHGATDETGAFCIDDIPPGTYDLEVRVDDYAVGYIRGVEVTGEVTSVEHDITDSEFYFAPPWPNPAQGGINFRLRTGKPQPVRLLVYDAAGRLVRGWNDSAGSTGERNFVWDLRNSVGARVPSGVYFVRLSAGTIDLTRSVVILQ
jgi:hypothetical protein